MSAISEKVNIPRIPLPDRDYLCASFLYDPSSGELTWKHRFDANRRWNNRFAGKSAGHKTARGYRHVVINKRSYCAHRVIWKMVYGADPDFIDHINRNRSDNRLENLRDVTFAENTRNASLRVDNPTGYRGVYPRHGRWVSAVRHASRLHYLGTFDSIEEAAAARAIYLSTAPEFAGLVASADGVRG